MQGRERLLLFVLARAMLYTARTEKIFRHRMKRNTMKIFKLSLLVLSLSLLAAACNDTSSPIANKPAMPAATPAAVAATPDALAESRQTYAQICSNCHKPDGSGGVKDFGDGKPLKVPTLLSEGKIKDPDADFIKQITEGGDGMPAYKKKLNEAQIKGSVAYVRELQAKK